MATSTTLPSLKSLVSRGVIKSFKLETIKRTHVLNPRDNDRLTLVFNDDEILVVDTFCFGGKGDAEIHIDNASVPGQ